VNQPADTPSPDPVAPPPAADVFEIPDRNGWRTLELPKIGLALQIPAQVKITESGRITGNTPQAGPYIGLELPSGRDVQIDALSAELDDSRQIAEQRARAGELAILHASDDALVTQPEGVEGCTISSCATAGDQRLCAVTGRRTVHGSNDPPSYPTLGDCSTLLGIMRSIEPR
jgi:hypothetical protein